MAAFAQWLIGFVRTVVNWLYNSGIDTINAIIKSFCTFVLTILSLFPQGTNAPSPSIAPAGAVWDEFLNGLNWLFPIGFLVEVITWTTAAIIAYLTIAALARWVKLLT